MSRPEFLFDGTTFPDPLGRGEEAVRFFRTLRHHKSTLAGGAFQLDPWFENYLRAVYGPHHRDEHGRLVRTVQTVFLGVPRGNRKTTFTSAQGLLHTIGPQKIRGGQVVFAAADRKQARLAFEEAVSVIRAHAETTAVSKIRDSRSRITHTRTGTFLESISSDAGTQHGRTPTFVLADELHAWKKRELWNVLRSGLPKTEGALLVIATTAGRGRDNICWELLDYARKVASGEIIDPAFLPVLFEADAGADWLDENLWREVNPGLSCVPPYLSIASLRQYAREAQNRPGERDVFRQLHLNVWMDRSTSPFIDAATWAACAGKVDLERLAADRVPCWLGVDLSSSGDLTSIVAVWPDPDREGGFLCHPWFFCPGENLERRADVTGKPYVDWEKAEQIIATPGTSIDLGAVEAKIIELCETFDVQQVAYDPALSHGIAPRLLDAGIPMIGQRQGSISMMQPIATAERVINGRFLQHDDHPILNWNVENIEIEYNALGHKVRLRKPTNKNLCVDGAVALVMALHHAAAGETGRSIYEDGGAREDGPLVVAAHEWDYA